MTGPAHLMGTDPGHGFEVSAAPEEEIPSEAREGRSLFLGLIGSPYESDLTTTALRLLDEALGQGHRVTMWTCGYATTLTLASLGDTKPRNILDLSAQHPSTAAVVERLLRAHAGRLTWLACRYCVQERGTAEQMSGVRVTASHKFMPLLAAADVSMILGWK